MNKMINWGRNIVNIICVDASRITLSGLRDRMQRIVPGAEVYTCQSREDAVELAKSVGCDVLLTDIDMGREGDEGIRLARAIQEINPHVNIIFITACGEWEYAQDIMQLRISGYVRKPYEPCELEKEFENLRYAVG